MRNALKMAIVLAAIAVIVWLASVLVVKQAQAQVRPSLRVIAVDGPCTVRELVHPTRPALIVTCESDTGLSLAMQVIR